MRLNMDLLILSFAGGHFGWELEKKNLVRPLCRCVSADRRDRGGHGRHIIAVLAPGPQRATTVVVRDRCEPTDETFPHVQCPSPSHPPPPHLPISHFQFNVFISSFLLLCRSPPWFFVRCACVCACVCVGVRLSKTIGIHFASVKHWWWRWSSMVSDALAPAEFLPDFSFHHVLRPSKGPAVCEWRPFCGRGA